jgi:aminotransferase
MTPQTASRLLRFTESIIRDMTRIANQYDAVNLSQGFPDFEPPQELVQAAIRALQSGHNQYGLTWGTPSFRKALAKKAGRFMNLPLDPETEITATCGSTEAMLAALMAVVNPGESVILFSPVYENYLPDTILTGAEPIYVPLYPPQYTYDPQELRSAFQRTGAKALILCNPSNPTSKVFALEELSFIANLAYEFDAFVITDEVYEHIVYPPHKHIHMASLPDMFQRTITCSSLSKTYAVTGWRVGYAIAPAEITEGIRKVHDYLTIGAPTPLQEAAVTALQFPNSYYQDLQEEYTRRRDLFLDYLDRAGLEYTQPQGAYYVMVDISHIQMEDDTSFCYWLAREIGVAAVPGDSFYPYLNSPTGTIRLHFAKSEDLLMEAGERLLRLQEYM